MKKRCILGTGIAFALLLFLLIPSGGAFGQCGGDWQFACWDWNCWCFYCNDRTNNVAGLCVPCGAPWEGMCWKAPACDTWTNNILGICTPCGGGWQGMCWSGATCSPGNDNILGICTPSCGQGYNNILGACVPCGDSWQGMCLVGSPCKDRNNNVAGLCTPCGAHWETACWSAPACDDRNNNILGLCTPCGETGEAICLYGNACDDYNRPYLGFCYFTGHSEEPTTNSTVTVPKQTPGARVWGWADIHEHQFANDAYGGAVLWGKPFDPRGVNKALAWCDYTWDFKTEPPLISSDLTSGIGDILAVLDGRGYPVHGTNWATISNPIPTQFMFGLSVSMATTSAPFNMHHVSGTEDFLGWPNYLDGAHQQMYYKWLERAYQAGLRLFINVVVNNEILGLISMTREGYPIEDMASAEIQINDIKALEKFIDLQNDGIENHNGWYRIAYSPQDAREIIEDGAMAVIIGIEVDSLFGCKPGTENSFCTETYIRNKIDDLYTKGVRHVFPVHAFDNAFAGADLYSDVFSIANTFATGSLFERYDCSQEPEGFSFKFALTQATNAFFNPFLENGIPDFLDLVRGADCNAKGLTVRGQELLTALMDKKMLIDIDHLSHRALEGYTDSYGAYHKGALEVLAERGYPPVSGHTVVQPDGWTTTEFGYTVSQVKRIRDMGGVIAVNPPRGKDMTTRNFVDGFSDLENRNVVAGYNQILALMTEKEYEEGYPRIGLVSDFGAFLDQPAPRFKRDEFGQYEALYNDDVPPLTYPYGPFEPGVSGEFSEQVTGHQGTEPRVFDYNLEGLAHVGLVPDMLADARANYGANLDPLFKSAEAFISMWEQIAGSGQPSQGRPPTITPRVTGQAGNNGWYTSDVTVEWVIVPQDQLVSSQGCETTIITTDTKRMTLTCRAATLGGENTVSVTIKRDTVPPAYNAVKSPSAAWTNQAVRVTFEATDATSGLAGPAAAEIVVDMEGAALTASYIFTDQAGLITNAGLGGINIDRTPPNVSFVFAPPVIISTPDDLQAELQRWHNADVVFDVLANDTLSGIATLSANRLILGSEGPAVGGSVTAVDSAGNSITVSSPAVKIDKTPPSIAFLSRTPLPNTYGWNNSDVAVSWTCGDALSGVTAAEVSQIITTEGADQSVQGTCTDLAGNTASHTVSGINIDKSKPSILGTLTAPPNANGWYNSDVMVTFSCTDPLSGLVSCGPSPQVITAEGINLSAAGVAVDLAGNTASTTVGGDGSGINVDKTAPSITCSSNPAVLWPANHKLVDVQFTTDVSDSLSGPDGFTLISAASNESGDEDLQGFVTGTADINGQLRAERTGSGDGRVYTMSYEGRDKAGNSSTCATTVTVPHDKGKK